MSNHIDLVCNGFNGLANAILEDHPEFLESRNAAQVVKQHIEQMTPEFVQDKIFQDMAATVFEINIIRRKLGMSTATFSMNSMGDK